MHIIIQHLFQNIISVVLLHKYNNEKPIVYIERTSIQTVI